MASPSTAPCDPHGIELVTLALAASIASGHPRCLDDRASRCHELLGQDRAEGPGSLDDDQRGLGANAPIYPTLGPVKSRGAGREHGVVKHGTRRDGHDREGVGGGMGIDTDDKVVLL